MGMFNKFSAEIKRTILRLLDTTARSININNPDLLTVLDKCPEGADTLISRIILVLTEKTRPSQILTERVRDAHKTKFRDIRFLIPVLSGLSKREVRKTIHDIIKKKNLSAFIQNLFRGG